MGKMQYPNDFSRQHLVAQLAQQHAAASAPELEQRQPPGIIAGRLVSKGHSGDTSTAVLHDASGRMTIVVSDQATGKAAHAAFAEWQLGDILGVGGIVCRLPSGELALRAHELRRLVRAARPLPAAGASGEPGSARYVDLLTRERVRRMAKLRYRLSQGVRQFLGRRMYMEVETPILQASPQVASQFSTHHHALNGTMYLRHSADLHLQKLLVGGVEQLFEISRNFKNGEGATPWEETAVEIYCAYTNDSYMMALLEALLTSMQLLSPPFARMTLTDAIRKHAGTAAGDHELRDPDLLAGLLRQHGIAFTQTASWGAMQRKLLDAVVAPRLTDPIFISGFSADAAAGARPRIADAQLAEYFEFFASGTRVAQGRSLQNDPHACESALEAGLERELRRALEYGLPPASCLRLSVDALVRVVSDASTLADTFLFRMRDET
jgi:lysyl-tRNA synthetase, class II